MKRAETVSAAVTASSGHSYLCEDYFTGGSLSHNCFSPSHYQLSIFISSQHAIV